MIRQFLTDSAKYFVGAAVTALGYLVSIPILSRWLSQQEFGEYLIATATVGLLSTVSVGWITPSVLRFQPHYAVENNQEPFNTTTIKLAVWGIAATCGLLVVTQPVWPAWLPRGTGMLLAGILAAESLILLMTAFLRATRALNWYLGLGLWLAVGRLALGLLFTMVLGATAVAILAGWLLTQLVTLAMFVVCAAPVPYRRVVTDRVTPHIAREIMRYGVPAVGMVLLVMVLSIADRYVLLAFRGPEEVALYAAAYDFTERSLSQLVTIMALAGGPLLFQTWEVHGETKTRLLLTDLTSLYLIVGMPATIGLCVLSTLIVNLLLPDGYALAARVVAPVAVGAFLWGLLHNYSYALGVRKRSDIQMFCFVPAAGLNLVLNLLFVPTHGYMAAAWTTLASYAVALMSVIVVSRRFLRWRFPSETMLKVMAASAVMAAVVYLLAFRTGAETLGALAVAVIGGVLTYGVVLVLLQGVPSRITASLAERSFVKGLD